MMRLTTWNCYHGPVDERLEKLRPLDPDLVTLQECRCPRLPFSEVIWSGSRELKGIAVVAVNQALRLERLKVAAPPTAVPVVVHCPTPFLLLALWALPEPTYEDWVLNVVGLCAGAAGDLPMVVTGDLNITAKADAVRRLRKEFRLVSAYHHHHGVEPGAEAHPTHFWRWHEASPWHIDFCFVPESWLRRVRNVEVGGFAEWNDSDHRPLTVTLNL